MPSGEDPKGDDPSFSWKDCYKTAQMISLPDVSSICGDGAGQLVKKIAKGVGCPDEFILMPLLSCCSALMRNRSEVRVHAGWSEPPVLWIAIGAEENARKSSALRQVLTPLLDLSADQRSKAEDAPNSHPPLPLVFTGYPTYQQLRGMMHESQGQLLHVTKNLEQAQWSLDMNVVGKNRIMVKTLDVHYEELYNGFAGNVALPPHVTSERCCRNDNAYSALSQTVCYNQCGFARPEYVVNLAVKARAWLSSRFLVSCPSLDQTPTTRYGVFDQNVDSSGDDSDGSGDTRACNCEDVKEEISEREEEDSEPRAKKARTGELGKNRRPHVTLREVYAHIANSSCRRYTFTKEARQELRRFQEEEWCTIVDQLGEEEVTLVSKSLGQIVRLAGVIKAFTQAVSDLVTSQPTIREQAPGEISALERSRTREELRLNHEDILRALELGKYFLEQKLSMIFILRSHRFGNLSSLAGITQQRGPEAEPSPPSVSSVSPQCPSTLPSHRDLNAVPRPSPLNTLHGFPKLFHPTVSAGSSSAGLQSKHPALQHLQQSRSHLQQQQLQSNNHLPHSILQSPRSGVASGLSPLAQLHHTTFPFGFTGVGDVSGVAPSVLSGLGSGKTGLHILGSLPSLSSPAPTTTATASTPSHHHHHHHHHPTTSHNNATHSQASSSVLSSAPHQLASPAVSSSSATSSSHAGPELDVSQLPPTFIPTTPEEEMAEMSQAAEFAQLEPPQFVAVHARRVKRLLECFDDGCGVSATTAAQKSIAPPVRVAGTNNRHPAWASALFFQKVADLGLGVAEQVRHPTNGRVYWRFRRKAVAELTVNNFQLLQYLRIDMERFSRQGHPSLPIPGLDPETLTGAGGYLTAHSQDDDESNASSKGNNDSPSNGVEIKQERV